MGYWRYIIQQSGILIGYWCQKLLLTTLQKNFKQQNSWEYEYESVENQPLMGIIGIYGVQYNTFLYMFFYKTIGIIIWSWIVFWYTYNVLHAYIPSGKLT